MIKSQTTIRYEFDNAELSLHSDNLTVTDSKSRDAVIIDGLDRLQVLRDVRWLLRYRAGSHNVTPVERDQLIDIVQDIKVAAEEWLEKEQPKAETEAEA